VKVQEMGIANFTAHGDPTLWASDLLIANNNTWTTTIREPPFFAKLIPQTDTLSQNNKTRPLYHPP
jgi:hypothetical protein